MKRFASLLAVIAFLAFAAPPAGAQSYRVIVHPDNPTDSLSKERISALLLKEQSHWDDNSPVKPVDLDSKSPIRRKFSRDVHGQSVASIKNYWQRQIFSGGKAPPPEVADDRAVIAFVRSRRGGIGYVSRSARLDGVKEVTISN